MDLTVCGSVCFKQTEAVVSALWTVGEAFQHSQVRNVEGGGQKISHLTHKFGQNHLEERRTQR